MEWIKTVAWTIPLVFIPARMDPAEPRLVYTSRCLRSALTVSMTLSLAGSGSGDGTTYDGSVGKVWSTVINNQTAANAPQMEGLVIMATVPSVRKTLKLG